MSTKPHDILKHYWGYDTFRPLQEDVIASVLAGHDTLALMPTGGGKSLTFQVPALALRGLTLVITPLISLMKDQCDRLCQLGIRAATVFMGMTHQQVLDSYERVISENYQFLYLSPERLETQLFRAKLRYMDVRLLVVDEAHCISQWGYDFRPPYLRIADIRKELKQIREQNRSPWKSYDGTISSYDVPCIAVTATATPAVVEDIQSKLNFRKGAQTFRATFERPNLAYRVVETDDKLTWLQRLLGSGESAIVYVRSRKQTANVAERLNQLGITASFYHAGLPPLEKLQRQEAWMQGLTPVIVATNAFGMGIDKADVRTVVHLDLPPSPEEYFQEAGRAGRDGKPAKAYLLYDHRDLSNLHLRLDDEYPDREIIRLVYGRLASFYQIAIGAGYNNLFEFDIMRFCSAYHMSATQVHYALRLLDQAGYISYIEEPDRHSRVMFTCSRESLYHTKQFDTECQRIMQALLRLYTGLFADFVAIREDEIMRYTGFDRQKLYDKLLLLSRNHILHYIPARQTPAIVYNTPRLDNDEIRISHTVYEDRRERRMERIEAITQYVSQQDECRLVFLLRYFGEKLNHTCGQCDVCLEKETIEGKRQNELSLNERIVSMLRNNGPQTDQWFLKHLDAEPTQIALSLQQLIDQGLIRQREGLMILQN